MWKVRVFVGIKRLVMPAGRGRGRGVVIFFFLSFFLYGLVWVVWGVLGFVDMKCVGVLVCRLFILGNYVSESFVD